MAQINIIEEHGEFAVWIDTEGCEQDGTIIGFGDSKRQALNDALDEISRLMSDLAQMRLALGPPGKLTDPEPLTEAEMNGDDEPELPL